MSAPFPSLPLVAFAIGLLSLLPPFSRDKSLRRPSFLPSFLFGPFPQFQAKMRPRSAARPTPPTSQSPMSLARPFSPLIILARKFLPLHSPMKSGLPLSLVPPSNFLADFRPCPSVHRHLLRARALSSSFLLALSVAEVAIVGPSDCTTWGSNALA